MGYTTDFEGSFKVTCRESDQPGLRGVHAAYLRKFASSCRMKRSEAICEFALDTLRTKAGLPVGPECGYCVNIGDCGVLDHNRPPSGQPGLWCQWTPTDDGEEICWDGGEKFYDYVEWLQYLVDHFLTPWGYRLDGEVTWNGEEPGDMGKINVVDSVILVKKARVVYD